MSFPRYTKYKDSGVQWLGEIPKHWGVQPLKHLLQRNDGGVWGDEPDGVSDTIVLRSTEQTVDGRWQIEAPALRRLAAGEVEGALLLEGDLLLTKSSGSSLHIGKTTLVTAEISRMRCCYSNFMQRLRPGERLVSKLAWYMLNNDLVRRQLDLLSNSTTGLANLNASMIGQVTVPVPTCPEQERLVAFLDRETAKIDELVAEQRRLMVLLKEKRQAVISHAVTKGLNPQAPMKPSGIEWLGDVPAHWELQRLSSISTKITNGFVGPTRDILTEAGVRYLQSLHIKANAIRFDTPYFVSKEWSRQHSKSILQTGDVLIVQTGDIGQAAAVTEEFAGCNCHALIIVAPHRAVVQGEWIAAVLNSSYGFHTLCSIQTGALHPHLNCGDVKDVAIAVPPIHEQMAILPFVASQLRQFDALSVEASRVIELLRERRTALISAAVTGQIDVRGLVKDDAA